MGILRFSGRCRSTTRPELPVCPESGPVSFCGDALKHHLSTISLVEGGVYGSGRCRDSRDGSREFVKRDKISVSLHRKEPSQDPRTPRIPELPGSRIIPSVAGLLSSRRAEMWIPPKIPEYHILCAGEGDRVHAGSLPSRPSRASYVSPLAGARQISSTVFCSPLLCYSV